jgi:hypothetical protein
MIRIVLDTNLLVSAILSPQGNPAVILKLCLKGIFSLLISNDILDETRRVFHYPKLVKLMKKRGVAPQYIDDFIDKLSRIAIITPGKLSIEEIQDDPDDNMVLSCALEGEADVIISGDHHLTDIKTYKGIKVLDPATFLKAVLGVNPDIGEK